MQVDLRASQAKAGAPIKAAAHFRWNKDEWALEDDTNFGTTPTSSPPATLSAFAYVESATPDRSTVNDRQEQTAGVLTAEVRDMRYSITHVVGTNYLAGHYLWCWSSLAGGAIQAISAPYLIR